MVENIIQFVVYSIFIVVVAKYMLYYCVRKIAGILKLKNKTVGQALGYLTSMPELISTLFIAYHGMMLTVTYNILSSNIINIILVLMVTGAFNRFKYLKWNKFKIEYIIIVISILLPLVTIKFNIIHNIILVPIYIFIYIYYLYIIKKLGIEPQEEMFKDIEIKLENSNYNKTLVLVKYLLIILFGIILLYFLGNKLGNIVYNLGTIYKIPELVLGIIIGFITSMPEMSTFIESYLNNKGKNEYRGSEEVVNNVVASNVSNTLIIQIVGIIIFLLFNK